MALKSWNKYANIAIFIITLLAFLGLKDTVHLSSNLITFLPQGKSKEAFETYSHFKNAKEVMIAVEGFDEKALKRLKTIEEHLIQSGLVNLESEIKPHPKLLSYAQKYPFYLKEFAPEQNQSVSAKLQALYRTITTGAYYLPIDKSDPLGYFKPHVKVKDFDLKNGHLALGDFGYLSVFSIKNTASTLENYQIIYDAVHHEVKDYKNVHVFSSTFYFVENAKKIREDVNFLIAVSTFLLLALYIVMIKNVALLFNTLATLLSSIMLSFLVLSLFWSEISLFVLAFGGAMSTVAIDYMFHHYFHGYYERQKAFNRSVFFGFLTTIGGFFIFSWVDFLLIKQLCVFAVLCLSLSYIQFVFLYPRIGFSQKHSFSGLRFSFPLPYRSIAILSTLAIVAMLPFLHVNTTIQNLDYQNKPLMHEEQFFKDAMKKSNVLPLMIEASSIDELIARSNLLKAHFAKAIVPLSYFFDKTFYDKRSAELDALNFADINTLLQKEAETIGFRKDFFQDAYAPNLIHPLYEALSMQTLQEMGFNVVFNNGRYFSTALIQRSERSLLSSFDFVHVIDAKEMFLDSLQNITHQLLMGGIISFCLIFGILFKVCRNHFMLSASYVLFPTALILAFCVGNLSIIHLFMLFIVMSLSIDYGIYVALAKDEEQETKSAILFSLISTFAGFGVLIFSNVGALHFMGLVTTIGIGGIFLLLMGRVKA